MNIFNFVFIEEATGGVLLKKIIFKIPRHSQKSTCSGVNVLFVEVLQIDQAHLMDHGKLFVSL